MRDPAFAREVAQACEWREAWCADQIVIAAERTTSGSIREAQRAVGRIKRHIVRLRHRPTKPLHPPRKG